MPLTTTSPKVSAPYIDLSETGQAFVNETRRRRDAWFSEHLQLLTADQRRILEQAVPILKELAEK